VRGCAARRNPFKAAPATHGSQEFTISVLRNLEARIEGLVEGVFSRAFSSGVQPVEIARKLAKEMDAHKTASVQRVYVPNEYTVWLCPDDYERFKDYESSLAQELSGHLLEHARHHNYDLLTRPVVNLDQDERLRLGEFGIQTRLVRPPQRQGADPEQGEHGHTMVYSATQAEKAKSKRRPDAAYSETRAIITVDDRRYVLDGPTATLGRSKEADCIIDDPNISRRHAELRRSSVGDWQIVDLNSTNGVKVNGRRVANARLSPGDEITLGTKVFGFDIEQ
jgi:FHA domain-containing protein